MKFQNNIYAKFEGNKNYFIALLDQILVSGANFFLGIIILRYLGTETFGIFSFIWLFVLLLNSLQLSLIINPMFSIFPKYSNKENIFYLSSVFIINFLLSIFSSIAILIIIKILNNFSSIYNFQEIELYLILVVFLLHNQIFLKKLYFCKNQYKKGFYQSILTFLSLYTYLFYLIKNEKFTFETLFLAILISNLVGFIYGFQFKILLNTKFNKIISVSSENWLISKWLTLTTITQWIYSNLWQINGALYLGPYIFGIFRACFNVANILTIIFQSFDNYVPIQTTKIFKKNGKNEMKNYLENFTKLGGFVSLCIFLMTIIFSDFILTIFYGKELNGHNYILNLVVLTALISFFQYPAMYGLRTLSYTKPIFFSYFLSLVISILFSNVVISMFNINGLIYGLMITQVIIVIYIFFSFIKVCK